MERVEVVANIVGEGAKSNGADEKEVLLVVTGVMYEGNIGARGAGNWRG